MNHRRPTSRAEAKALGLITYRGLPCGKDGHQGLRYVRYNHCVQCQRERQRIARGLAVEKPKATKKKARLPVVESSFIRPPTMAQLMSRRGF